MIYTKEQYKDVLTTMVAELKKVTALIMAEGGGKEADARKQFNEKLYDKFNLLLHKPDSPFEPIFSLYVALDEYLNSEGARMLGAASKEHVRGWYSNLDEDIQKATTNIETIDVDKEDAPAL